MLGLGLGGGLSRLPGPAPPTPDISGHHVLLLPVSVCSENTLEKEDVASGSPCPSAVLGARPQQTFSQPRAGGMTYPDVPQCLSVWVWPEDVCGQRGFAAQP